MRRDRPGRALVIALALGVALTSTSLASAPRAFAAGRVEIDRAVARFSSPELGGSKKPRFVFERELAFAARLEAIADPDEDTETYAERHVRTALDRIIAETLLSQLATALALTPGALMTRTRAARARYESRLGRDAIAAAAAAEGIANAELDALYVRQARASFYLDKMLAPLLDPSEDELKTALRSGTTPFSTKAYENKSFADIAPLLKRWFVAQRVAQATAGFYQAARVRVTLAILRKNKPNKPRAR